jgi:hypothetical protein
MTVGPRARAAAKYIPVKNVSANWASAAAAEIKPLLRLGAARAATEGRERGYALTELGGLG